MGIHPSSVREHDPWSREKAVSTSAGEAGEGLLHRGQPSSIAVKVIRDLIGQGVVTDCKWLEQLPTPYGFSFWVKHRDNT